MFVCHSKSATASPSIGSGNFGNGKEKNGDIERDSNQIHDCLFLVHRRFRRPGDDVRTDHVDSEDASSRSEEHTSELQSLMRISYAVFCLKKKTSVTCTSQFHHSQLK